MDVEDFVVFKLLAVGVVFQEAPLLLLFEVPQVLGTKHFTLPVDGFFGETVKAEGLAEQGHVVVAAQAPLAVRHDGVHAFLRPRAVADDVPQADDFVHLGKVVTDVRKRRLERFVVSVYVADDCLPTHLSYLPVRSRTPKKSSKPSVRRIFCTVFSTS